MKDAEAKGLKDAAKVLAEFRSEIAKQSKQAPGLWYKRGTRGFPACRFSFARGHHEKMNKLLDVLCGLLSGVALFAIMALTFFDVLGRKLLSNSIPGSLEVTELLMVVVIFGALPMVSRRGEHVEFDSLDPYLPRWVRRAQAVLVHLLCAAVLLALGWLMWRTGAQFGESGETTAQLKLPKAPFIYGMGVLCALTGVVHLVLLRQGPGERAEGEGAAP